jgi:Rrf2 family protein
MKIGSKGDYGLRALIDLAEHYNTGAIVQAKEIADRQAIPKDYLALIMGDLRRAGLIESTRGPSGGYRLARPPKEITMGEALRLLETPVSLIDCTTDLGFDGCSLSLRCRMRNVWIEAGQAVQAILDRTTIADLCGGPQPGGEPRDEAESAGPDLPKGHTFQI